MKRQLTTYKKHTLAAQTILLVFLCVTLVFILRIYTHESNPESNNSVRHNNTASLPDTSIPDTDSFEHEPHMVPAANQPSYQLTTDERYMLATLVYLEARSESFECQKAVASVVINRMEVSGKSLYDVIYEPNQFTPACNISYTEPSYSTLVAVDEVIERGTTLPIYVTYFRADKYHDWGNQKPYINLDNTYFSYDEDLMYEYVQP